MDHWAQEEDYHQAFETMAGESTDALMVNGLGGNFTHRQLIADSALNTGFHPFVGIPTSSKTATASCLMRKTSTAIYRSGGLTR
jgi:hypothetical protein